MVKDSDIRLVKCFKQSFDISARMSRRDYWLTVLQYFLFITSLFFISGLFALGGYPQVFVIIPIFVILFIPATFTMNLRRYRDLGVNPVYMFLLSIVLNVFTVGLSNILFLIFTFLGKDALYTSAPNWLKADNFDIEKFKESEYLESSNVKLELDIEEQKRKNVNINK